MAVEVVARAFVVLLREVFCISNPQINRPEKPSTNYHHPYHQHYKMSSPTEASHRGYTSHYTIQYTGSQRDRFGVEQRQKIWAMLSGRNIEIYPEGFTGQWDNFPRVARFRANLTALSQHYNLYFVAYMGWIHVYIPNRSAKGILDRPVALLGPEKSESRTAAYAYGQYIRACSQEVNHLVVGDLGDKEVVLVARDNGDVVACMCSPQCSNSFLDHAQIE